MSVKGSFAPNIWIWGAVALGAAGALGAVVLYVGFGGGMDRGAASPTPSHADSPAAEAQPETASPEAEAPRIEDVRIEPDGLAVIAGQAAPSSTVTVVIEGAESLSVMAGPDGTFAAITDLEVLPSPRLMRVEQELDGNRVAGDADIVLAPTRAPPSPQAGDTPPQDQDAPPSAELPAPDDGVDDGADDSAQTDTVAASAAPPAVTSESVPPPPQAVAVLRATPDGVERLDNASRPEAPQQGIVIDTISYDTDGGVQLAGRSQPGSRAVRVYLDDTLTATFDVDGEGRWRGALPDVAAGLYRIRADEIAAQGQVTSSIESTFKREDPAHIQAAHDGRDNAPDRITIQTGHTLWAIARERYGAGILYVQIFEANRDTIRNPHLIYPGQIFALPDDDAAPTDEAPIRPGTRP